jgi:hypothetical protein
LACQRTGLCSVCAAAASWEGDGSDRLRLPLEPPLLEPMEPREDPHEDDGVGVG